ncbi:hypothetical protein [Carboxylicivirga sp. N1Y90]|uniref:hypothetical protein n=1 Tax=Carboxylicivirga fragile TaxID=3417571 RepID=UPI003D32EF4A|nr:hypothetical protein [Marinilabiliaceae bacterium N1Y90]
MKKTIDHEFAELHEFKFRYTEQVVIIAFFWFLFLDQPIKKVSLLIKIGRLKWYMS